MELAVGQVLEGTITGITKFGAFVALEDGKSGLVHISEIANTFVNDVHDHVQMGQKVKVKVLSLGEAGKINLSIKKAEEAPRQNFQPRQQGGYQPRRAPAAPAQSASPAARPAQPQVQAVAEPSPNQDFEDRLKRFMQESDSKIADTRRFTERRQKGGRRR